MLPASVSLPISVRLPEALRGCPLHCQLSASCSLALLSAFSAQALQQKKPRLGAQGLPGASNRCMAELEP